MLADRFHFGRIVLWSLSNKSAWVWNGKRWRKKNYIYKYFFPPSTYIYSEVPIFAVMVLIYGETENFEEIIHWTKRPLRLGFGVKWSHCAFGMESIYAVVHTSDGRVKNNILINTRNWSHKWYPYSLPQKQKQNKKHTHQCNNLEFLRECRLSGIQRKR